MLDCNWIFWNNRVPFQDVTLALLLGKCHALWSRDSLGKMPTWSRHLSKYQASSHTWFTPYRCAGSHSKPRPTWRHTTCANQKWSLKPGLSWICVFPAATSRLSLGDMLQLLCSELYLSRAFCQLRFQWHWFRPRILMFLRQIQLLL